ncbi:MAG: MarR family transcriptional regulator [Deltaproteobacteria bacterium]|nr:MarR family transcriptional regulator [Deltaproteobacteria bacterium]
MMNTSDPPNDVPEVTDCPYYLVSRATLVITNVLRRELQSAGIDEVKPAYLGVLMSLWTEDSLKVVELGRRAGLEPSTMTGLLDRMERDGLVIRAADPADRRAHRIRLTEAARSVQGRVLAIVDESLAAVHDGVSERDAATLKKTLRKLLTNAQQRLSSR